MKAIYKNKFDGRTETIEIETIDKLINHIMDELNEYAGIANQDEDPEVWTTRKDIVSDGKTFYSTKWSDHHTWTIKGGEHE